MTVLTNDPESLRSGSRSNCRLPALSIGPDTSFCGHLSITLDAGEGFAGYYWSDGSQGQTYELTPQAMAPAWN